MKYRHAFHAGNFADVHKHVTLVALLQALARKDKGFLYVDTHAGSGAYPLAPPAAARANDHEAAGGIGRFAPGTATGEPEIDAWLEAVAAFRREHHRRHAYPGSPQLAMQFLRPQDRALLIEAEASVHAELRRELRDRPRVVIENADGFARATSAMPPIERRALVLIDPAYEDSRGDFDRAAATARAVLERFATGVIAIWYPIKLERDARRWLEQLAARIGTRPLLVSELWIHPRDSRVGLNGSGMAIVNPPYLLDERMRSWLPLLQRVLAVPGAGGWEVRMQGAEPASFPPV
ncbi:MAG: 23S rRNA (adenine(2030)-N(6))-methyltransferase RlmJ [Steroidobacteraceae bacterium]|nr:23S rRNA (adenine(2030)-N(6))-methyltransferase RlmJ [Nevskiaceae bacterium]MCP5360216.1 23S rRNA (adenine(2030)-N(6))-methyltransferase RlmJ [Nevskiaceae bacterium]MCP5466647.1 23S rRNA (adenine(2030)-N(6))-methyltransferase RlmJ [Nevskiaceae bacterium]